jgi:hypothetical protein
MQAYGVSKTNNMKKIKHFKNRHFTWPLRLNLILKADRKKYKWTGKFLSSAKYDFKDPNDVDEMDWSKFCGISYSPILNGRKNSIMVGWRYDGKEDEIQVAPYWHDDSGDNFYPGKNKDAKWFVLKPAIDFEIVFDSILMVLKFKQGNRSYSFNIPDGIKTSGFAREINSWFGGTDPSPYGFHYLKSKLTCI